MSTFFQQTAQAMIAKHIDRFPLLKLDQVIDWQPIEQYLNRQRTRYLRDHRGRPAYPLLVGKGRVVYTFSGCPAFVFWLHDGLAAFTDYQEPCGFAVPFGILDNL